MASTSQFGSIFAHFTLQDEESEITALRACLIFLDLGGIVPFDGRLGQDFLEFCLAFAWLVRKLWNYATWSHWLILRTQELQGQHHVGCC